MESDDYMTIVTITLNIL